MLFKIPLKCHCILIRHSLDAYKLYILFCRLPLNHPPRNGSCRRVNGCGPQSRPPTLDRGPTRARPSIADAVLEPRARACRRGRAVPSPACCSMERIGVSARHLCTATSSTGEAQGPIFVAPTIAGTTGCTGTQESLRVGMIGIGRKGTQWARAFDVHPNCSVPTLVNNFLYLAGCV